MGTHPFLDPRRATALYSNADRISTRTAALHRAKISGADATETICDLLCGAIHSNSVVADIGCGRGTTSITLARRFKLTNLTVLDLSRALLDAASSRFAAAGLNIAVRQGDFHHLPFETSTLDAAVVAFCLYHSPTPEQVIGDIARCLHSSGNAVLVTKSADSYSELDDVVAASGLDPYAHQRPSLYTTFHSGNIRTLVAEHLSIMRIVEQPHLFRFNDFGHLAAYLATTARYHIHGDATQVAVKLRAWRPDTRVTMSSTVTYLLGTRP